MNEKFLSRGKRKDNGEWVEGYYVELPEDQHGKNFCLIIGLDGQYNRIVPETAGRCTGLTDKNGKMIFARDIVRVKKFNNDPIIGKVVFNENTAGFEVWWDIVVGAYGEKATRKENFAVCGQMEVMGETDSLTASNLVESKVIIKALGATVNVAGYAADNVRISVRDGRKCLVIDLDDLNITANDIDVRL